VKRVGRRLLLLAPLLVLLFIAGAYLLLDAWLEGAGGRRAVEDALTERLGLPVNLRGRFNVMLLPAIGVSGTDLVIGEPGAATEAARSGRYAVALALLPLLDGELLVQSFELRDGQFYFERLPDFGRPDDGKLPTAPMQLPEIRLLSVSDFAIFTGEGEPLRLQRFQLKDFAAGTDAPFELAVAGLGEMEGGVHWDTPGQALTVDADWSGLLPGSLAVQAVAGVGAGTGFVRAGWASDPREPQVADVRLAFGYALMPGGARIHDLRLEAGTQAVSGGGCYLTGGAGALHLDLAAAAIDFDALPDFAPLGDALGGQSGDATQEPSGSGTPGLNLRLRATEARLGGALAREAEFRMGGEPACAALEGPPAAPAEGS
jgi:hypothetical protein